MDTLEKLLKKSGARSSAFALSVLWLTASSVLTVVAPTVDKMQAAGGLAGAAVVMAYTLARGLIDSHKLKAAGAGIAGGATVGGGVDFTPSITPAEKLDAVKRAGGDGIAGY